MAYGEEPLTMASSTGGSVAITQVGRGMPSGQKTGSHLPHLAGHSSFQSPQGNWQLIVPSSTLGVLLVLVLILLMILYFRKARRSAAKGEDKSHHIYNNIAVQKEPGTEHRKDLSPRQRQSQLSWGSDQQKGSDEDTGAICYASLIHLNQFGPEDSIYVNTQPKLKPMPDPLLTVEYACIPGTRPQPTKSTAPDRELKS